MTLVIPIILALVALAGAVASIANRPSLVSARGLGPNAGWWNRLTAWGYARIVLAFATFLLIALNEYFSSVDKLAAREQIRELQETSARLREEVAVQTGNLDDARQDLYIAHQALAGLLDEANAYRNSFRIFDRSTRRLHVYLDSFELHYDGRVSFSTNYVPRASDRIEWRIDCMLGDIPDPGQCSFGRLMAGANPVSLSSITGASILSSMALSGTQSTFEAPNGETCRAARRALQQQSCFVSFDIFRTAENIQLDIIDAEPEILDRRPMLVEDSSSCRAYEILHGESCTQMMERILR